MQIIEWTSPSERTHLLLLHPSFVCVRTKVDSSATRTLLLQRCSTHTQTLCQPHPSDVIAEFVCAGVLVVLGCVPCPFAATVVVVVVAAAAGVVCLLWVIPGPTKRLAEENPHRTSSSSLSIARRRRNKCCAPPWWITRCPSTMLPATITWVLSRWVCAQRMCVLGQCLLGNSHHTWIFHTHSWWKDASAY